MGPFLTALRDGKLIANKVRRPGVLPAARVRPRDGGVGAEPEFVEVGPGGTVVGWTWIAEPIREAPVPASVRVRADQDRRHRRADGPRRRRRHDRRRWRRGMRVLGAVPRRAPRRDHRRVLRARGRGADADHHAGRGPVDDHRAPDLAQGPRAAVPAPPALRRRACWPARSSGRESRVSGKVVRAGPRLRQSRARAADRGRRGRRRRPRHGRRRSRSSRRCSTTARRRPSPTSGARSCSTAATRRSSASTSATSRSTDFRVGHAAAAPSGRSRQSDRSPDSTTAAAAAGRRSSNAGQPTGEPDVDFETVQGTHVVTDR